MRRIPRTRSAIAVALPTLVSVCALAIAQGQVAPNVGGTAAERTKTREDALKQVEQIEPDVEAALLELRGSSPTVDADLALAKLAVIEARMAIDSMYFSSYGEDFTGNRTKVARAALELARRNEPIPIVPGALQERGYFTKDDGTVQCYHVIVPDGYDAKKPTPVFLFCHGYDPYTTKIFPWVPEYMQKPMDAVDALFVIPYGRRNTDFLGPGESDVLAVLDEVKRSFNVDSQRVYVSGVSAGASGVWTLATHYPDQWAAVIPISGRVDYYLWKGFQPEDAPLPRRIAISANNPLEMPENMRNLPARVYHGAADPYIPPENSRRMVAALEPFGLSSLDVDERGGHRYWEEIMPDPGMWRDALQFRLDPMPKQVSFRSFTPKYNKAYWVEVDQIVEFGKPFSVDARITAPGKVEVKAENVLSMRLHFPEDTPGGWAVTGLPNGQVPDGLRKTPKLVGPVENAYCGPFVMVYGTAGDDAADKRVRALAEANAAHWDAYADGRPELIADTAVTADTIRDKNLILFGRPEENAIVARIADGLPLRFIEGGYEYLGQQYTGPGVGAAIVYPNPLGPERLVVVHSGALWCKRYLDIEPNHRLDWLTDIVIFRESASDRALDEVLCFGWFDVSWQPAPQLTAPGPMQPEQKVQW